MTTLSTRYTAPLLAMLVPALLAVWAYCCGGIRSDDCADSSALLETAWIEGLKDVEEPDAEPPPWLLQSTGGTVTTKAPRISALKFRILRSFEPERLYGDPLDFVLKPRPFAFSGMMVKWLGSGDDALPIHELVTEAPGATRLDTYVFLYGSRPVVDPFLMLLSTAFQRIATGPRPLTLVTASLRSSSRLRGTAERLAEEWLASAWEHYRSVCMK